MNSSMKGIFHNSDDAELVSQPRIFSKRSSGGFTGCFVAVPDDEFVGNERG